jgi:hypothetical protein
MISPTALETILEQSKLQSTMLSSESWLVGYLFGPLDCWGGFRGIQPALCSGICNYVASSPSTLKGSYLVLLRLLL